jgi:hypothetical protein
LIPQEAEVVEVAKPTPKRKRPAPKPVDDPKVVMKKLKEENEALKVSVANEEKKAAHYFQE